MLYVLTSRREIILSSIRSTLGSRRQKKLWGVVGGVPSRCFSTPHWFPIYLYLTFPTPTQVVLVPPVLEHVVVAVSTSPARGPCGRSLRTDPLDLPPDPHRPLSHTHTSTGPSGRPVSTLPKRVERPRTQVGPSVPLLVPNFDPRPRPTTSISMTTVTRNSESYHRDRRSSPSVTSGPGLGATQKS